MNQKTRNQKTRNKKNNKIQKKYDNFRFSDKSEKIRKNLKNSEKI